MRRRKSLLSQDELGQRLTAIADAFDAGRFGEVVAWCEELRKLAPRCVEALHFQAAALEEEKKWEQAEALYREGLQLAPEDPDLLLDAAHLLFSLGGEDPQALEDVMRWCARGHKLALKSGDEDAQFEFLMLEGMTASQSGACELGLEKLNSALRLRPASIPARVEKAIATFELCRFDAAEQQLLELLSDVPEEPWAHYYLGLLQERRGRLKEAERSFARARELAPQELRPPVNLSEKEFDAAVEAAVSRLPEPVKKYLANTAILVQPIPRDEDLLAESPPLSPSILGVFHGTHVGARSVTSAQDHFPARIILYQRNLERFAQTQAELIEQIGITVMHEVGHLIGLEEEDLWERGLD